jgi:hypothetical protein
MDLAAEILADFQNLLTEHGVKAKWKSIDLLVLVSRVRNEQQIDMGGFVEAPDLSLRIAKVSFRSATLPKFGERIEVDGTAYRISKVSAHTRSPILNLSLTTTDE